MTINQSQKNVEQDSDRHEFHIEIKESFVEEGEESEVVVAPKTKRRKVIIAYNSDDSDEEKKKTQRKTNFENDSDDATSESVPKLNKIVSYDDTNSDRNLLFMLSRFGLYTIFLFRT